MFWGTVIMETVLKILRNERFSGGALILLGCTMFWVYGWADSTYAKKAELQQLQQTVESGFESIAIEGASQEIRDVKLSKQIALAIGSTPENMELIEERLAHARDYKQCLVERGTNCEHLRDVE